MRYLGLVLLAACSSSPDIDVEHCWEYKLPAGWATRPAKTANADLVFAGPDTYRVGTAMLTHVVTVKFVGGDLPLDAFQRALEEATKHPDIVRKGVERANPDDTKTPVGFDSSSDAVFTPIQIDGYPGFRTDVISNLTLGGTIVNRTNSTLAVKVGRTIVSVSGGFVTSRRDQEKPASDAILASVHFAKCAAK